MTLSSRTTTLLAIVLVVSLAVNFFIAGMFFAHPGRPHFGMMGPRGENTVFVHGAPGGLSREGREIIRQSLEGQGASIREHAEAMSKAQDAIRKALRARPFDPAALDAAQDQMRQAVDAVQTAMQSRIAQVAAKLSDEDRAALADMPVQSPIIALRLRDRERFGSGRGPDRFFLQREMPSGDSTPPTPDGER